MNSTIYVSIAHLEILLDKKKVLEVGSREPTYVPQTTDDHFPRQQKRRSTETRLIPLRHIQLHIRCL